MANNIQNIRDTTAEDMVAQMAGQDDPSDDEDKSASA